MRSAPSVACAVLRTALLLAAFAAVLAAPAAHGSDDVDVRKGGSLWARIEGDGAVRIDGSIAGGIEEDGTVRVDGRIAGRVEEDGAIRDDGTLAGRVEKDGTLRRGGTIFGRIEDGGSIRRHGSIWGEASPCCPSFDDTRRLAALLYFFEPGFFRR